MAVLHRGKYTKVFAWFPVRILESCGTEVRLKTVFLSHYYSTVVRGQGGALTIQNKTRDSYFTDWRMTVNSYFAKETPKADIDELLFAHNMTPDTVAISEIPNRLRELPELKRFFAEQDEE